MLPVSWIYRLWAVILFAAGAVAFSAHAQEQEADTYTTPSFSTVLFSPIYTCGPESYGKNTCNDHSVLNPENYSELLIDTNIILTDTTNDGSCVSNHQSPWGCAAHKYKDIAPGAWLLLQVGVRNTGYDATMPAGNGTAKIAIVEEASGNAEVHAQVSTSTSSVSTRTFTNTTTNTNTGSTNLTLYDASGNSIGTTSVTTGGDVGVDTTISTSLGDVPLHFEPAGVLHIPCSTLTNSLCADTGNLYVYGEYTVTFDTTNLPGGTYRLHSTLPSTPMSSEANISVQSATCTLDAPAEVDLNESSPATTFDLGLSCDKAATGHIGMHGTTVDAAHSLDTTEYCIAGTGASCLASIDFSSNGTNIADPSNSSTVPWNGIQGRVTMPVTVTAHDYGAAAGRYTDTVLVTYYED